MGGILVLSCLVSCRVFLADVRDEKGKKRKAFGHLKKKHTRYLERLDFCCNRYAHWQSDLHLDGVMLLTKQDTESDKALDSCSDG